MIHYFVIETLENIALPPIPKGEGKAVILTPQITHFNEVDYDARNQIVSERFKRLLEMFVPKYIFIPIVYLTEDRDRQSVYWRFNPPTFEAYKGKYRNDGIISHIAFNTRPLPILFTTKSPKGIRSIVVRKTIAESTLRRGIHGLKFTHIQNLIEE